MSRWSDWLRLPRAAFRGETLDETPLGPEDLQQVRLLAQRVRQNEAQLDTAFWTQSAADCRAMLARTKTDESTGPRRSTVRANMGSAGLLGAGLGALLLLAASRGDSSTVLHALTWWGEEVTGAAASQVPARSAQGIEPTNDQQVTSTVPSGTIGVEHSGARQLASHIAKETRGVSVRIARPLSGPPTHSSSAHERPLRSSSPAAGAVVEATLLGRAGDAAELNAQAKRKPVARDTQDDFAEQVQVLKRADRALKAGNAGEARRQLARTFTSSLVPHATALRAVLACQSGDTDTGKRMLDNHANQSPNSPYLSRVRRACRTGP